MRKKMMSVKHVSALVILFFTGMIVIGLRAYPFVAKATPSVNACLLVSPPAYVSNALGETFTIDVNVSCVENLRAFELKLSYNTTLLDVTQVIQGPFFPQPPNASIDRLETNEAAGLVWASISLSDCEPPRNGSGTLATITFSVTFAPATPTKACCLLDLHETILYSDAMQSIVHYSIDGLYFWKSILDDPAEDLLLDLVTQKGGVGLGVDSPHFSPGEIVQLTAYLTYKNEAVQHNFVAFSVLDPGDETIVVRSGITDRDGIVTIEFRIPTLPESWGTWKAISVSDVKGITVWDSVTFMVSFRVGGHAAAIEKTCSPTLQIATCLFILVAIVMLIMVGEPFQEVRSSGEGILQTIQRNEASLL